MNEYQINHYEFMAYHIFFWMGVAWFIYINIHAMFWIGKFTKKMFDKFV